MKRIEIPETVTYRYRVLNGTEKRGFRISRFEGDTFLSTVKDERLTAINAQFLKGELTKTAAREKVDQVVESLYKADGVKISRVSNTGENEQWVAREFKRRYRTKNVIDKDATLQLFCRAIRCLGEDSIFTADVEDMQAGVNEKYGDQKQRAIVSAMNTLLKWAGRHDTRLQPYPKKK
ncbi:MAG TPA: hypothetical protein VGB67_13110, partial [Fibrella sp.]